MGCKRQPKDTIALNGWPPAGPAAYLWAGPLAPLSMEIAQQRKREALASNVLFVGLAVGIADSLRTIPNIINKPLTLATLAVGLLFIAGYFYAIRRGVTVVKWLFVLGQSASLVYAVVQYRTMLLPVLHTAFWPALAYVVFFGSRIVAALLLLPTLRPRSSAVR
jgi:hypothetical protein